MTILLCMRVDMLWERLVSEVVYMQYPTINLRILIPNKDSFIDELIFYLTINLALACYRLFGPGYGILLYFTRMGWKFLRTYVQIDGTLDSHWPF